SAYTCLGAAVGGALSGTLVDGAAAWRLPTGTQALAILVLGVLVTAVAFLCWYTCVAAIGAERAAVMVGLMPVAGLAVSVLLGAQQLTVFAAVGATLVAVGCL